MTLCLLERSFVCACDAKPVIQVDKNRSIISGLRKCYLSLHAWGTCICSAEAMLVRGKQARVPELQQEVGSLETRASELEQLIMHKDASIKELEEQVRALSTQLSAALLRQQQLEVMDPAFRALRA
jgi:wobble nucleotide-excising tRNase